FFFNSDHDGVGADVGGEPIGLVGHRTDRIDAAVEDLLLHGIDADGHSLSGLDARDHRFVYFGADAHLLQIGDANQLLAFAHRLALGHEDLPAAPAHAGLLGNVVNYQAITRGGQDALLDFILDFPQAGQLLVVNLLLRVVLFFALVLLGLGLLNGLVQVAI